MRFRGHLARVLFRAAALVLVCSTAFAALTSTASADKSARNAVGRCDAHLSKPQRVKETSEVVVWSREGTSSQSGEMTELLYACLRPAGRSVAIGETEGEGAEYVGNVDTTNLTVSGTLVSDVLTSGFAEEEACGKYDGANCGSVIRSVARVYNLATGRSIRQSLAGTLAAFALTSKGAIAWEEQLTETESVLEAVRFDTSKMKASSVQTIDKGALGSSLRFTGLELEWVSGGTHKRQTITNGQMTGPGHLTTSAS